MKRTLLFTALGNDRPGLTAAVLTLIYRFGANVEESYTKVIRGQFLLAVAASFPPELELETLKSQLEALDKELSFPVSVKEVTDIHKTATSEESSPYLITVLGADHPGIMFQVTSLLSCDKINITNTESRVIGGKEKPVYVMILEVEIPESVEVSALSKGLDQAAKELRVEIELKPMEIMTL